MRYRWLAIGSVVAALIASGVAGIGCGGSSPTSPSLVLEDNISTSFTGTLSILMKDAPIDNLSAVSVYITGVSTQVQGGAVLAVQQDFGAVELLALRDKTIEVVNTQVPTGTYEWVAFSLDASRSSVVESGVTKPLAITNGEAKVLGPFTVTQGAKTTITVDFDAEKSLTQNADGSWTMNPVVVLVTTITS